MIVQRMFRFYAQSETLLEYTLRGLSKFAALNEERERFFFTNLAGQPKFSFECHIVEDGIDVEARGQFFSFLGALVEALIEEFGKISIEKKSCS